MQKLFSMSVILIMLSSNTAFSEPVHFYELTEFLKELNNELAFQSLHVQSVDIHAQYKDFDKEFCQIKEPSDFCQVVSREHLTREFKSRLLPLFINSRYHTFSHSIIDAYDDFHEKLIFPQYMRCFQRPEKNNRLEIITITSQGCAKKHISLSYTFKLRSK